MIEIQSNPVLDERPDEALLARAARVALENQSASQNVSLSILMTNDAQIQSLNREYRGFNVPTDVLSFDVHEYDPETDTLYLGEIIISVPYAAKQAQKNGHPLEAEVQLLVVHGVLHILGHDHAKAEEKSKMWDSQNEILAHLGLAKMKIQEL